MDIKALADHLVDRIVTHERYSSIFDLSNVEFSEVIVECLKSFKVPLYKENTTEREFTLSAQQELWPQASGELSSFAQAMEKRQMNLTAAQLRMAIQMANEQYKLIYDVKEITQITPCS